MKNILRAILGIVMGLCGLGLISAGAYLLWTGPTWVLVGIFIPLVCAGLLFSLLGYDLVKGRSIKDDLFFVFFN